MSLLQSQHFERSHGVASDAERPVVDQGKGYLYSITGCSAVWSQLPWSSRGQSIGQLGQRPPPPNTNPHSVRVCLAGCETSPENALSSDYHDVSGGVTQKHILDCLLQGGGPTIHWSPRTASFTDQPLLSWPLTPRDRPLVHFYSPSITCFI